MYQEQIEGILLLDCFTKVYIILTQKMSYETIKLMVGEFLQR